MKVKNIMFSGFAAALFVTMGGEASAADTDVKLITKDYADEKLQGKLTPGNNIVISEDDTISASFALGENEDGTAVTIEQALESKADASAVESLEGLVGEKSVAQQITDKVGTIDGTVADALDTKLTAKSITGAGVTYDELTSVYTITDKDTTYETGTAETSGLTKLYGETGENTNGTMTQAAITTALGGKLASDGNAVSATKATQDGDGNVITTTYATQATVNTKVTGIKTAGTYLVNFDSTGNASYAPIQILGSNGRPIDLTTGAVTQ